MSIVPPESGPTLSARLANAEARISAPNDSLVTSTGGTTARSLAAWMADENRLLGPSWRSAGLPILIGHRGSSSTAPENTFAAFDVSAALDGVALETDIQRTADNALVAIHDPTTTRTTNQAATIAKATLPQLRVLDASYIFPGVSSVFVPQRIPTFDEYLRRYGRTSLLLPEVKDQFDSTATLMAQVVSARGLDRSVAIQSMVASNLAAVRAVNPAITTVFTGLSTIAPAAAQSSGAWAVFVPVSLVDAAYVASLHAVGIKVFVYSVAHPGEVDAMLAAGIDGMAFDDPAYGFILANRTPTGSTVLGVPPVYVGGSGWNSFSSVAGVSPAVSSGYVTFGTVGSLADGDFFWINLPVRLAATPTTQTITTTLKVQQATATTTRWFGLHFCWTTDNDNGWDGGSAADPNGYTFAYRLNGTAEISKVINGVGTTIATDATWAAIGAGSTIPIRVDISATAITVTRTDSGKAITVANSEVARGGLIGVIGAGIVPGVAETTIVY